jgi:hypothetical protein
VRLTIIAVTLSLAGPAAAEPFRRTTLEMGVYGARWDLAGDVTADGFAIDARILAERTIGFQVSYAMVAVPDRRMPERGDALHPDLRAELVIAPVANPYFSPVVTLGAGQAGYGDGRISLIAGLGAEVMITDHIGVSAMWRVVEPQPFEVADAVRAEIEARDYQQMDPATLADLPSPMEMFGSHYNLDNQELLIGLRFVL